VYARVRCWWAELCRTWNSGYAGVGGRAGSVALLRVMLLGGRLGYVRIRAHLCFIESPERDCPVACLRFRLEYCFRLPIPRKPGNCLNLPSSRDLRRIVHLPTTMPAARRHIGGLVGLVINAHLPAHLCLPNQQPPPNLRGISTIRAHPRELAAESQNCQTVAAG